MSGEKCIKGGRRRKPKYYFLGIISPSGKDRAESPKYVKKRGNLYRKWHEKKKQRLAGALIHDFGLEGKEKEKGV